MNEMNEMNEIFEKGKRDGHWTMEQVKRNFASVAECMDEQQKLYDEDLAGLPQIRKKNPLFAKKQEQYLEGLRVGWTASLSLLMQVQVQEEERKNFTNLG